MLRRWGLRRMPSRRDGEGWGPLEGEVIREGAMMRGRDDEEGAV